MTPTEPPAGLVLRPASDADATSIADLYSAARVAAVPQMPAALHTNAEDRVWFAERLADAEHQAWVAELDGDLAGFALFTATWLDHLFIRPNLTGHGVGTALLDTVKALHPAGVDLWVFESNLGARRFYERHGFVEVLRTDGSGNEERAPDVHMAWRP